MKIKDMFPAYTTEDIARRINSSFVLHKGVVVFLLEYGTNKSTVRLLNEDNLTVPTDELSLPEYTAGYIMLDKRPALISIPPRREIRHGINLGAQILLPNGEIVTLGDIQYSTAHKAVQALLFPAYVSLKEAVLAKAGVVSKNLAVYGKTLYCSGTPIGSISTAGDELFITGQEEALRCAMAAAGIEMEAA